jgi:hypothetical protein
MFRLKGWQREIEDVENVLCLHQHQHQHRGASSSASPQQKEEGQKRKKKGQNRKQIRGEREVITLGVDVRTPDLHQQLDGRTRCDRRTKILITSSKASSA